MVKQKMVKQKVVKQKVVKQKVVKQKAVEVQCPNGKWSTARAGGMFVSPSQQHKGPPL